MVRSKCVGWMEKWTEKGKSSWQYPSGGSYPGQIRAPGSLRRFYSSQKRCCHIITVDLETYINQNGIWSYKLFPFIGKAILFRRLPLITIIFYCRADVNQDNCMVHLLSKENSVFWRTHFRIQRYVSKPKKFLLSVSPGLRFLNEP